MDVFLRSLSGRFGSTVTYGPILIESSGNVGSLWTYEAMGKDHYPGNYTVDGFAQLQTQ